jgi:hypothetical protein
MTSEGRGILSPVQGVLRRYWERRIKHLPQAGLAGSRPPPLQSLNKSLNAFTANEIGPGRTQGYTNLDLLK